MALMQMESDAELVARSLKRDNGAFEELIRRYTPVLYSQAYLILRDAHGAEDAVQETFVRAFRKLGTLQEGTRFSAWLMAIHRNGIYTMARRKPEQAASLESHDPEDTREVSVESLDEEEVRGMILDSVGSLPEKYSTPLMMHYMEGMTYRDVAERLEMTLPELKGIMFRGVAKLRKKLTPLYREYQNKRS